MQDLLAGLDARQRDAVTSPARRLAILAPAGAGKTRVLTRRVGWRVRERDAHARHVLAVTFTRNAAGQLVDRLRALGVDGVTAGTFHALALAQLRRRAVERGTDPPQVLASKARLIGPLLRERRRPGEHGAIVDVIAEIEWAKARMLAPAAYPEAAIAAGRRPPMSPGEVADLYAGYEEVKGAKRVCDFDDLLWRCADAIDGDPAFAAAQRWRFRHVFVDEFQDATPLQLRLLRGWLGDTADLCVVGDPAQAIYGFAGADVAPLLGFATEFPGGSTIALDHNYRSTPQIVTVAESVLGPGAGVEREPVRAVRDGGAAPSVRGYADESAEANAVAHACWEAYARGVAWERMAVLFRTNAQSAPFEHACARRGVPVTVSAAGRFADRPAVRALLDRLRTAERADRRRPFAELLADLAVEFAPPKDPDADTDTSADTSADAGARTEIGTEAELREHRDALLRLGREYLATEAATGSVAGFATWLDLATRPDDPRRRGVDLLTFHRAKGLEWHLVFVAGVEQGFVPIAGARTPAPLAEERRLLHVALSRATDELHVSWAAARMQAGRPVVRQPSPWLDPIEVRAHQVAARPVDVHHEVARLRAALDAATPPAPVPGRRRAR